MKTRREIRSQCAHGHFLGYAIEFTPKEAAAAHQKIENWKQMVSGWHERKHPACTSRPELIETPDLEVA
ncbi:MAG TPA: hypothetical protein VKU41_07420 [Polyangiaceae bacterium]|nr:hypothetical protein [Polyangiaceae bacterium]